MDSLSAVEFRNRFTSKMPGDLNRTLLQRGCLWFRILGVPFANRGSLVASQQSCTPCSEGVNLPNTLIFDYPTISSIADFTASQMGPAPGPARSPDSAVISIIGTWGQRERHEQKQQKPPGYGQRHARSNDSCWAESDRGI